MSDSLTFELNDDQRDVLLRGLRFVRRSIMLKQADPTPAYVEKRSDELQDVEALSNLISARPVAEEVVV
jgi:hypothetical protein